MNEAIIEFKGEFSFLSNFYICTICYDSRLFPSSEHLFQSKKAINFDEQEKIRLAKTPGQAKRIARQVDLVFGWDTIKDGIMEDCLKQKFAQNHELRHALINTKDLLLVEGNYWHDNYWGDCFCKKCKSIEGHNTLGKLLMKVRNQFIESSNVLFDSQVS